MMMTMIVRSERPLGLGSDAARIAALALICAGIAVGYGPGLTWVFEVWVK